MGISIAENDHLQVGTGEVGNSQQPSYPAPDLEISLEI
jgi:hypothetical protein